MSKERELLKKAVTRLLETRVTDISTKHQSLINEIEELLAQPEQEPVAWMNDSGGCFLSDGNKYSENWTALYTSPQKREPLSDEILYPIAEARINDEGIAGFYDGFRYAEKHHGIGE